jgi:PAS domain S-box-containing protein
MLKRNTFGLKGMSSRLLILLLTVAACLTSALYFVLIRGIEAAHTHIFYVPIVLAGIWYHKKAVYVALLLSMAFLLAIHFSPLSISIYTVLRAIVFISVAYIAGHISSKRAHGEQAIIKSEALTRREKIFSQNIVATVPDSLLVLDKDLRIKSANRTFYETFQTEPEKVIGSSISDILPDEDGRLSGELTKLLGTGDMLENLELHYRSEILGERIFNVTARGMLVAEEEEEEEELVVVQDITRRKRAERALKESEAKYRNLIDQSQDAIYLLYEGKFELINKRFEELLGYTLKSYGVMSRASDRTLTTE